MTILSSEQRAVLRELIKKYQLESIGTLLDEVSQSAVHMIASAPDDYSTVGNTRIGGVPDLPLDVSWAQIENAYLVFIAQINLAELPHIEGNLLPSNGILYFFHENTAPAPSISHRVIYYAGDQNRLKPAELPNISLTNEYKEELYTHYAPYRVSMKVFISTPYYASIEYKLLAKLFNSQTSSVEFAYSYFHLQNELRGFQVKHDSELGQFLGFPTVVGHEDRFYAQLCREGQPLFDGKEPNTDEVKKWRLLFELGSHQKVGMLWWDGGFLQFLIHQDELEKLDFSHTYAGIATS